MRIYIFGAHSRARTLAVYLSYIHRDLEIIAYLYDNGEENPDKADGIPVKYLGPGTLLHTEYPVYIGTRGSYHKRITGCLREYGFKDIYPVTAELDLALRNRYLKKYFSSIGREYVKIDSLQSKRFPKKKASKAVYVVNSVYDKILQQKYPLAPYEKEIQAGAALTKTRLSRGILTDNTGANISEKNRQYCELTALYWIWKHAREDIIGLAHYRRRFLLPQNWEDIMREYEIDVILPVPLYVCPSLAENYKSRHCPSDWDFMMEYLKKRDLCIYQEAETFFAGNLYSPCNMFIMRKETLHEFCAWLFPILNAVVSHGGEKTDSYLNRYPGFLSERLLSFYFEKNRERYHTAYADKNFLT